MTKSTASTVISATIDYLDSIGAHYVVDSGNKIHTELSINLLLTPEVLLRPVVEAEREKMKKSLLLEGQKQEIVVKPVLVEGEVKLFIYDGVQRTGAMYQIDPNYKANIVIDENATLRTSIVLNVARVKQSPQQIVQAVKYMVDNGYSFPQISSELGFSEDFINKNFLINYLPENVKNAFFSGVVTLSVATEIAKAVKRGDFTPEEIKELIEHALGEAIDVETGKKKAPATSTELASIKSTWSRRKKLEERKASGLTTLKPVFVHKPAFDKDRLDTLKARAEQLEEQKELDGELTIEEQTVINTVNYLFTNTPEDIQNARVKWEALHPEK